MTNALPAIPGWWEHVPYLLAISSVLLGAVGLLLAIGGVFAFLNLRGIARREARAVAERTAQGVSEAAAVRYLESELPNIVREYRELAGNAATYEDADDIADSEGDEK